MRELTGIGLHSEADFLRRSNNRTLSRQKRIKIIKLKGVHVFFIFATLVALALFISKTGRFLMTWEKLNIQSFNLVNCPEYHQETVKSIVRHYRGNIISFDFEQLRGELLKLNEVKSVALSKKLPSTIEVCFELRKPVFQVKTADSYEVFDEEGTFLYNREKRLSNLFTATGVDGPGLKQILPLIPELQRIKSMIDYIDLERPDMVMVKLKGFSEVFVPGESVFVDKIIQYLKLKKKMPRQLRGKRVKRVDLRFENRFYLEFDEEVNG
jgi:cell division septal protein FtsQ